MSIFTVDFERNNYFVVTAKILNAKIPEINVTVRSTGSGIHNIRLLEKREVDLGAIDTSGAWAALVGKEPFEGKPFPDADMRILYIIATNPLQFVVSEKSGVKDIYGLEGKTYTPGMLGSTGESTTTGILNILGVHPKMRHMSYADALEAMKNEQIVGFSKYSVPDSSILDVASAMKIRILSFTDPELEKIVNNVAGLKKTVVPSGMYPGVGEFKTVENEWANLVRKDFSTEIAYRWVKTVWENRAEIKQVSPMSLGDRLVEVSLGVKTDRLYFHPGAIRFYRELGMKVPKNLIPPEMGEK